MSNAQIKSRSKSFVSQHPLLIGMTVFILCMLALFFPAPQLFSLLFGSDPFWDFVGIAAAIAIAVYLKMQMDLHKEVKTKSDKPSPECAFDQEPHEGKRRCRIMQQAIHNNGAAADKGRIPKVSSAAETIAKKESLCRSKKTAEQAEDRLMCDCVGSRVSCNAGKPEDDGIS